MEKFEIEIFANELENPMPIGFRIVTKVESVVAISLVKCKYAQTSNFLVKPFYKPISKSIMPKSEGFE